MTRSSAALTVVVPLVLVACGGRPAARRPLVLRADAGAELASNAGPPRAGDELPDLEVLAARATTDAPLMREAMRTADATRSVALTATADTCYRAVVATNLPVQAWFEDATRAPRGVAAPATPGTQLVPPQGPACARRGEVLRLVVTPVSDLLVARAVAWQSP